eukprot:gene10591-biopygen10608
MYVTRAILRPACSGCVPNHATTFLFSRSLSVQNSSAGSVPWAEWGLYSTSFLTSSVRSFCTSDPQNWKLFISAASLSVVFSTWSTDSFRVALYPFVLSDRPSFLYRSPAVVPLMPMVNATRPATKNWIRVLFSGEMPSSCDTSRASTNPTAPLKPAYHRMIPRGTDIP